MKISYPVFATSQPTFADGKPVCNGQTQKEKQACFFSRSSSLLHYRDNCGVGNHPVVVCNPVSFLQQQLYLVV